MTDGPLCTLRTKLVLNWGVGVCKGLPYLDMADPDHSNAVVMLQTVHEKMADLAAREVKKDFLSLKALAPVGTPNEANFVYMVSKVNLTNSPVTPVDIANARHMFGPDLPGVKSKTVRRKTGRVEV